jgi:hypothetical protein
VPPLQGHTPNRGHRPKSLEAALRSSVVGRLSDLLQVSLSALKQQPVLHLPDSPLARNLEGEEGTVSYLSSPQRTHASSVWLCGFIAFTRLQRWAGCCYRQKTSLRKVRRAGRDEVSQLQMQALNPRLPGSRARGFTLLTQASHAWKFKFTSHFQ